MASIVVIASSTSRVSAMISAPREMRWRSMPKTDISGKTMASVSGMDSATIEPARRPSAMKDTAMMIRIACQRLSVKSPIASSTVTDWSATRMGSMPMGRSARISAIAALMLRPSARMSPASRIATARPMAGWPLTRNIGCGGSAVPRRTSAMSPRRKTRSPATKLTLRISLSLAKAPETRTERRSSPVSTRPAGRTRFCACSAAISAPRFSPSPARRSVENSMKMRSSCAPRISTFETSRTSSRRERAASTWSRSSRWLKPSEVKP